MPPSAWTVKVLVAVLVGFNLEWVSTSMKTFYLGMVLHNLHIRKFMVYVPILKAVVEPLELDV